MSAETDWTGWAAQAFEALAVPKGLPLPARSRAKNECPAELVAGWVKGAFGLDYRPFHWDVYDNLTEVADPFCWMLTHLPSGWGMCALAMVASEARAFADEIAPMADWDALNPASALFLQKRMFEVFDRYPGRIFNSRDTIGPFAKRVAEA